MAWAITPEDRAKYTAVFEGLNPENGKLSGETVRPVLMKSGLEVAKDGFNFKLLTDSLQFYSRDLQPILISVDFRVKTKK